MDAIGDGREQPEADDSPLIAALDGNAIGKAVQPSDVGRSCGRLKNTHEHTDRGRLAGSVGPEQGEQLAGMYLQRQVPDGLERAIAFRQIARLDGFRNVILENA